MVRTWGRDRRETRNSSYLTLCTFRKESLRRAATSENREKIKMEVSRVVSTGRPSASTELANTIILFHNCFIIAISRSTISYCRKGEGVCG